MARRQHRGVDKIRIVAGLGLVSAVVIAICYLIDFKGGIQIGILGLILSIVWIVNQGDSSWGSSGSRVGDGSSSDGGDCD